MYRWLSIVDAIFNILTSIHVISILQLTQKMMQSDAKNILLFYNTLGYAFRQRDMDASDMGKSNIISLQVRFNMDQLSNSC